MAITIGGGAVQAQQAPILVPPAGVPVPPAGVQVPPAGIKVPPSVTVAQAQSGPIFVPPSANAVRARPSVSAAPPQPQPAAAPAPSSAVQAQPPLTTPQLYIDRPALSAQARENVYLGHSVDSPGTQFVKFFREGEWYFSFGTSRQYWAPTDIHVSQPSQGNDFTVHGVQGHDEPDMSGFLSGDLFGPQYNIRIGRFINDKRTIGVELNFDHTKYTSTDGQVANVTGTIGGVPVNGNQALGGTYFRYLLHNGANSLMTNLVYRQPLLGETNETLSLAFIGKAGAGIMVPHADNTILGNPNNVGQKVPSNYFGIHNGWWQFGGWTTGVEGGFRWV
ncbi:MAG TPA: hypothetical protein VGC38_08425, partial [Pseudolabrys sp.]